MKTSHLASRVARRYLAVQSVGGDGMQIQGLADSINKAMHDALAKEHEDRVGEQFVAPNEALWEEFGAEISLEFPDDGNICHVIVVQNGDGEPTGYSSSIDTFSAETAASFVEKMIPSLRE